MTDICSLKLLPLCSQQDIFSKPSHKASAASPSVPEAASNIVIAWCYDPHKQSYLHPLAHNCNRIPSSGDFDWEQFRGFDRIGC